MKQIFVFLCTLMISSVAFADGGIPLLLVFGSNFFLTGTAIIPFVWGAFLFWIVCKIEEGYLIEKFGEVEKFKKYVPRANILSTLWGIPLTIILIILGETMPCIGGHCNRLMTGLFGPAYNLLGWLPSPIAFVFGILLYLAIFIWESWFVEYRYLRKKLNFSDLKKQVLRANIRSYKILGIIYLSMAFLWMMILFIDKL